MRYADRLPGDLDWLAAGTLRDFHGYAFATFRQYGAAFELAAAYLRWLERHGELELDPVAVDCDAIATAAKALQFKVARLVQTRRRFDVEPIVETMAAAWDNAMNALDDALRRTSPARLIADGLRTRRRSRSGTDAGRRLGTHEHETWIRVDTSGPRGVQPLVDTV